MSEYPSKPLESWEKAKELRRKLFWSIWKAHDEGKLLVQGVNVFLTAILAGMGDAAMAGVGPNFGSVSKDLVLLRECHEIAGQKGYRESTCASMRQTMGMLYKGIFYRSPSGEQIVPDLCLDLMVCPHQTKGNQVFRDYYGIPHLIIEAPPYFEGDRRHHVDFLVAQMHDAAEWMEKTFKREYDDEKLIEATYTEWDISTLYAKAADMIKAVPAPIDSARFYPFCTPILRAGRHNKMVKEIFLMLVDELKDRVRDGIAVVSKERCRLTHEGQMPYFYGNLPRLTRKYGAVMIGGATLFGLFSAFTPKEDGSWEIPKTPRELGIEIRNRDDAFRSLAELLLFHSPTMSGYQYPSMAREAVGVAKDWHADGVIMHVDRGCRSMTAGVMEVKHMMEENGIPVMLYEGNTADPRDFNRMKVESRVEVFMERLGLTKLSVFN